MHLLYFYPVSASFPVQWRCGPVVLLHGGTRITVVCYDHTLVWRPRSRWIR